MFFEFVIAVAFVRGGVHRGKPLIQCCIDSTFAAGMHGDVRNNIGDVLLRARERRRCHRHQVATLARHSDDVLWHAWKFGFPEIKLVLNARH